MVEKSGCVDEKKMMEKKAVKDHRNVLNPFSSPVFSFCSSSPFLPDTFFEPV